MDVGAGDVHLDDAHLLAAVQRAAIFRVLLRCVDTDVGDDRAVENLRDVGQLLRNHKIDARILKSHRVQHPAGRLRHAGLGISKPGLRRGTLEGKGPQDVQVIDLRKLPPVSQRAGGGNHRIFKRNARQGDLQLYHAISSFRNTGPSLQTRRGPPFVSMVQPTQAPKPQAIRASKLYCPIFSWGSAQAAFSMGVGPQTNAAVHSGTARTRSVTNPFVPRLPSSVATKRRQPRAANSSR
ncbi:hypothetical protein SDC9_166558 [bioreactor metagenome]|uniref:Uncharacterized protein n=1 Tax=bioreactor metagenome TaxID=1076179 RepID=A0A645FZR9_9ZZZZ